MLKNNERHDTYHVAVIMSIYSGDKLSYIKSSLESIFIQKGVSLAVFLSIDGQVNTEIYEYLDSLKITGSKALYIYKNTENKGLATRLNELVFEASKQEHFKYIARMDADDICAPNRLVTQCRFLERNSEIDIVGSDVIEIDDEGNEIFYKKMKSSHEELVCDLIRRCPFNHPTVVFRNSVFTRYKLRYTDGIKNTQDYYLWVDCLAKGLKFANINKPLLFFRVNSDFHSRRGLNKAKNDFNSRMHAMKKLKLFSLRNLGYAFALFLLRVSPTKIKTFAYKNLR